MCRSHAVFFLDLERKCCEHLLLEVPYLAVCLKELEGDKRVLFANDHLSDCRELVWNLLKEELRCEIKFMRLHHESRQRCGSQASTKREIQRKVGVPVQRVQ